MKSFVAFLLTGILSFVAGIFYPWWTVAVVSFIIAIVFKERPVASFFTAFLSIFLLWFGMSYLKDLANDSILANRISQLFLGSEMPLMMALISGLVGGIVAGIAALSGAYLRNGKKEEKVFKPSYL